MSSWSSGKNNFEQDFQISKHHFISQRENQIMGYTLVSGNKPSSVALHQNHIIVFIEMLNKMPNICSKFQYAKNQVGWCWKALNKHLFLSFHLNRYTTNIPISCLGIYQVQCVKIWSGCYCPFKIYLFFKFLKPHNFHKIHRIDMELTSSMSSKLCQGQRSNQRSNVWPFL